MGATRTGNKAPESLAAETTINRDHAMIPLANKTQPRRYAMNMSPIRFLSSVLVVVTLWPIALVHGQAPNTRRGPQTPADSTMTQAQPPAKGELDEPYVDGSFGFTIRPPKGLLLYREKRPVASADVQICQFASLEYKWSLAIRHSTTTRPLDTKTMLEGITSKLTSDYQNVQVLRGDEVAITGRQGVRYAASFSSEQAHWLRQQAVVNVRPTEFLTIVFVTPATDRPIAETTFDKIIDSFQILRTELTRKRIDAALRRGTALLRQAADGMLDVTAKVAEPNYLLFIRDGEKIGFVEILEQATTLEKRPGIRILQNAWLFTEDSSISHMVQDVFLAKNLSQERWENRVEVLAPPQTGVPRQTVVTMESGLRQDDTLIVKYNVPPSDETKERVLKVESSYASTAWQFLLPRLIDLTESELYAFSSYSSDRRGIVLRTFEVVGPSEVMVHGQSTPAFKLEDSEGLIPPISEIHVDKKGRILRVIAGPLQMQVTTRKQVERDYGSRIKEATRLLRDHSPQAMKTGP